MPSRTADVLRTIADGYRKDYEVYRDSILTGSRNASVCEKLKVKRQEEMLANGVEGYHFDWNAAVRPLVWITTNLRFPMGIKRGKPMVLAKWQVYDIMVGFGWISDTSGKRLYTNWYYQIPRKNGKSTLAGAILDYCCFGETDGVDCYIGATTLDQARETFKRSADSLTLGRHKNVQVADSKNNKTIKWKNSTIWAISAAPKDGKLAYCTVIDEYHQHPDNQLVDSILSGNLSDQQSLLIRITTAGTELNGVCHEEYEKCRRILRGELSNKRYFVSIYEADESDDPNDVGTWYKANPNLGDSVDFEDFQGLYENARPSETDMITFKTKNLNMWVRGMTRWANMPLWMEQCRWPVKEEELEGKPCYGGLDLSTVYDFTALTLAFPMGDGKYFLKVHCWVAESQVDTIARRCAIPLRQWMADGYVTATPGEVIDYQYIRDYLNEANDTYDIRYIAADRWNLTTIVTLMPDWFEDVVYEVSQGMKSMSQMLQKFERAYRQGEVSCNGNPVMDWMMDCVDVQIDSAGNQKPIKGDRKKAKRIDGVIASIMAYDCADVHAEEENVAVDYGNIVFW